MNPLYNFRPLIYREREYLDEFLDGHPIWGEFYNLRQSVCHNVYNT